jgi:hypothetical protein
VLGDVNLDKVKKCDDFGTCPNHIQTISIAKVIVHEDYSSKSGKNDIALIKLESPVNLSSNYTYSFIETSNRFNQDPAGFSIFESTKKYFEFREFKCISGASNPSWSLGRRSAFFSGTRNEICVSLVYSGNGNKISFTFPLYTRETQISFLVPVFSHILGRNLSKT